MENNTGKRSMKNKEKIKLSLTEMLETLPIEEITVTELCKQAGVNRATFYYHYESVHAVLQEIQQGVEREFEKWLNQSTVDENGAPKKSFYVTFFEFVQQNAGVCKLMLASQRPSDFLSRALEAGRSKVMAVMTKIFPACPSRKIDYYYTFVSNGFMGLLRYWLHTGMKESAKSIAEVGEQVSNMGIAYLS